MASEKEVNEVTRAVRDALAEFFVEDPNERMAAMQRAEQEGVKRENNRGNVSRGAARGYQQSAQMRRMPRQPGHNGNDGSEMEY